MTDDAIQIREFREGDLDAVVAFSLRAWEPVFASIREVLGEASTPITGDVGSVPGSRSTPPSTCNGVAWTSWSSRPAAIPATDLPGRHTKPLVSHCSRSPAISE